MFVTHWYKITAHLYNNKNIDIKILLVFLDNISIGTALLNKNSLKV